jgi:hypothetical protein
MGLIAVEPLRIGDQVRQPGYKLTAEDMKGRNISAMKRHGHVKWVDDEPQPRARARRDSSAGEE